MMTSVAAHVPGGTFRRTCEDHKRRMKTHLSENLKTYGIENWGAGYFEVSDEGNLVVSPDNHRTVEVMRIVEDLQKRGVTSPIVSPVSPDPRGAGAKLNECFRNSIAEFGYSKPYRGVYPIKVNQRKEVVEEILRAGQRYGFGIEVGSKPELMGALALEQSTESLLILNGIKDESYVAYAYLAAQMGRNVIVVCESLHELFHVVRMRKKDEPMPLLGFRRAAQRPRQRQVAGIGRRHGQVRPRRPPSCWKPSPS
jgi:arginine decarboxylase